jgi:lysophospholipase L1-like esterase
MGLGRRETEIGIGIGLAGIALAVSPFGLRIATGRLDFNLRIEVLSLTLAVFVLIWSGAFVSYGRARRAFFYLIVWSFPLALLAAVEAGAVAVRLSEWIAPTEDKSILNEKDRRSSPYLMSAGRFTRRDGVMLYKPWRGDGIVINEDGLRTKSPTPKQLGEWRIAVTGGSAVWGAYVLDVDTIPVQLQQLLDRRGHHDISVYNFGIEAIDIANELAVLRRFRELYSIDQVIFYTGGNDATQSYLKAITPPETRPPRLLDGGNSLELIKVIRALQARFIKPSEGFLAHLDAEVLPKLRQNNSLINGMAEARTYCRQQRLQCEFVLQPMLLLRKNPVGPEIALARSIKQLEPRWDVALEMIYQAARNSGADVHDFSNIFDGSTQPLFVDAVHVNEAANRIIAEHLATIAANRKDAGMPSRLSE